MAVKDYVFVYDNFAPHWLWQSMMDEICNASFPWHFPAAGVLNEQDPYLTCFGNNFVKSTGETDYKTSPSVKYLFEYFKHEHRETWQFQKMLRCRINMYAPGQITRRHYDSDVDNSWALLYYLNNTDGGTEIEGTEYEHKANRAVIFPADMQHQALKSSIPGRITINWNFTARFDWEEYKRLMADK